MVSAGYVLPQSEGGTAVRIRADMYSSFSRRGGWRHSLRTVGHRLAKRGAGDSALLTLGELLWARVGLT